MVNHCDPPIPDVRENFKLAHASINPLHDIVVRILVPIKKTLSIFTNLLFGRYKPRPFVLVKAIVN